VNDKDELGHAKFEWQEERMQFAPVGRESFMIEACGGSSLQIKEIIHISFQPGRAMGWHPNGEILRGGEDQALSEK
jgi:hypothetical protein